MPRRFACLAGALILLLCGAAPARADFEPRIINGTFASPGEYPAQGFLELETDDGRFVCGGTLVSRRHFLTAAHCATQPDTTTALAPGDLTVTLGKVDKNDFEPSDERAVSVNDVHDDYTLHPSGGPENDVALLTLASDAPAGLDPLRLIEPGEGALWANGANATVIGWGDTQATGPTGFPGLSDELLEATVPMRSDAYCGGEWGAAFHAASMVCAGGGATDTCGGDSGGPLMVSDGAFFVLAGLTSWGADPCGEEGVPGVYTRLGAPALNAWVRARVPMARASVSDATVAPGETATFSATASAGVTGFEWDFDGDGDTDATGASVTHAYPAEGRPVARLVAGGVATDKVRLQVGDGVLDPDPAPAPGTTTLPATTAPPVTGPPVATPRGALATLLVAGRPRVRGGRFPLRVRFAAGAPTGTAVIELVREGRTIGIARTRVVRGATRRVRVKLTPSGRRLLARGRLKAKVRVRVGRRVLRTRSLTLVRPRG